MTAKNRFQDSFSTKSIGTGKLFSAGNFSAKAKKGLAGALRKAKGAGRHTYTKNLSKEDLTTFQKIIGKEMSQLSTHSKGLGRKARARIMSQAENLRQAGKISAADKTDLRAIVKALGATANQESKSATAVFKEPRERATAFVTDKSQPNKSSTKAGMTVHTKANISLDNVREMTPENQAESGSEDILDEEQVPELKSAIKKGSGTKKINPNDAPDVIAKRGNIGQNSDDKIVELDIG